MRPTSLLVLTLSLVVSSIARADTEPGAANPEPPATPEASETKLAPKVAVVIAGDPDSSLQEAAATLETECTHAGLRTPSDPALRGALTGTPAKGDDGLDGVRALRRGLGIDPRKDLSSYKRLGTIAGADALVVLRREGELKLEVFDVSASQFYEGMLDFERTTPEERTAYIKRRAETAQARWGESVVVTETSEATPSSATLGPEPVDEPKKKRWIKKAWPYFVVGALLVGGVTYIIVDQRRTNDPGPPLLRFRPGDQ